MSLNAKSIKSLQVVIDAINRREHLYPWLEIDDMFSANEIHYSMPDWEKLYRFVLVRKPAPVKDKKQLKMELDVVKYDYQIIVTNIEYLSAVEIFHEYNQRCNIENKIDELKEGFAFDQNSQRNQKCNELFLLIKMVAYNLHNWFKQAILPADWIHYEIKTIRRRFYQLAANICGQSRYRHIRYARDQIIERLITGIIDRLRRFSLIPA